MSHIITVTPRVFFIKSNDFKVQQSLFNVDYLSRPNSVNESD